MARFISPLGRTPDTKELSSSTDFTVDATTDIVLDADGGDILFKDGGTTIGEFTNSSSDLVIKSSVSDKDILVKGNDGGSAITAITLDMSAAGKATFNNEIVSGAVITSGAGLVIADGGNIGSASDTDAIAIAANGVVTFSQAPVFPDGSIDIADIDLDGGTDIGASIADADLFLIDDGAGGTMRKTAASRLKTYINASAAGSVNADDIAGGDAAVTLTTTTGDITIDAAANDSDIILKGTDGGSDTTFLTIDGSAAGKATFNNEIVSGAVITSGAGLVIADAGTIGSASDTDAIAIASNGAVTFSQAVSGTSADFDGGVTIDNITIDGTEIDLSSGDLTIDSAGKIILDADGSDAFVEFHDSGTVYGRINQSSNNMHIRSMINSADVIIQGFDSGGSLVNSAQFDMSDSGALLLHNNIKMASDGAILKMGVGNDVTLTHVHDSGLTLTNRTTSDDSPVVFQLKSSEGIITANEVIASIEMAAGDVSGTDASTVAAGIHAIAEGAFTSSANPTKLVFTTGVSETAAASATAKMTLSSAGLLTIADDFVIKDGGTIGSASDTDAIAIAADGVVTMNQIPVFSAGINVSGGNIAGTLSTAAQTNITSVGTLTALTVDDVAINGKVITMTGSSSDTAVFTAGTNGTLSIVTTDAAAAAANITITADGTFEADGTTITLDSGGDIVLDADGADVIFKDGGTTILSFTNSSSDAVITSGVQDKDIIFKGDDGGAAITALTLDMSAAGAASFNSTITCTPTATLLIKNSSGSTLKTIHGVNSS